MSERLLPKPSPSGWKWIMVVLGILGTIGVTLSLIFRTYSDNNDPSVRERRRNAEQVSYAVVFSKVPGRRVQAIIEGIITDIGADSSRTDLVIGAAATHPWSKSIPDYRIALNTAMTDAPDLPIGKQTLIPSMVAGLLFQSEMPARLYLIGTIADTLNGAVQKRTQETAKSLRLRNASRAPVHVISYMDTTVVRNREYLRVLRGIGLDVEQREITLP